MDLVIGDRVVIKKSQHVGILNEIVNDGSEGYKYAVWDSEKHMVFHFKRNEIELYMAYATVLDDKDRARQDIAMGKR